MQGHKPPACKTALNKICHHFADYMYTFTKLLKHPSAFCAENVLKGLYFQMKAYISYEKKLYNIQLGLHYHFF